MTIELQEVEVEVEESDPRSASEKATDLAMGAKDLTALDRQFARIVKAASEIYGGKQLKKYLVLGEECFIFVQKATDAGAERSKAVERIGDRLADSGMSIKDIRVNDWMGVFGLAMLVTGESTVKDMDPVFLGSHAYRTFLTLKVGIERDRTGLHYEYKTLWGDFIVGSLRDGQRGEKLEAMVKDHTARVEEHVRATRMKSLTPDKQHQIEMAELAREQDKQLQAISKAAEAIRDRAIAANVSPDDLLHLLVKRGVVTPPEPVKVPMDSRDMAEALDKDTAVDFANHLVDRGNRQVIMAVCSILSGWLKANAEKNAA